MWYLDVPRSNPDELRRTVPALAMVAAPDGTTRRIRVLAPGEPIRHEGLVAAVSIPLSILSRGLAGIRAPGSVWTVLVQRQRGPWRGFETLHTASFVKLDDAERHAREVRAAIERGEPLP